MRDLTALFWQLSQAVEDLDARLARREGPPAATLGIPPPEERTAWRRRIRAAARRRAAMKATVSPPGIPAASPRDGSG